jgi:hypothetical protein
MRSYRRLAALVAMALSVSLFVGCTDDPTTGNNSNNIQPEDPSEVPEDGQLLHVAPDCDPGSVSCLVDLTWSSSKPLMAKLVDADGEPIENAAVEFEMPRNEAEGTFLSAATVYTNEDGIAEVELQADTTSGSAEVRASAEGLEPIKWVVGVSSKGSAAYRVMFEHAGNADLKKITVRLLESSVTCDEFMANPNQQAIFQRDNLVDAQGNLPTVVFPDIDNGESYTAVAKAFSAQNDEVEVAYGCKDGNPPIENGQPVDVIVPLIDYIPHIVGEYSVTHSFDLRDALPENVRQIVDLIGLLATDPGAFLVGCPDGGSGCPAGGVDGLVQILVDFLPAGDLRDTITDFLNSSIGNGIVRDAINGIADDWLDNNAPEWLDNTVDISGDIYETLKEFRVEGLIRISERPVVEIDENTGEVVGLIQEGTAEQVWSEFLFFWSNGCEGAADPQACATRSFGASEFATDGVVDGEFTATVVGSNKLIINQHTLSLNYGALLVGVVEKVVLPAIFGNECGDSDNLPCDSIDLALQEIIACSDVADAVADPGETTYGIVDNLCQNLLAEASDRLRAYASENLVASGEDVFLIGSPSEEACTIYQPEVYQDDWPGKPRPYIEKFGEEDPTDMRCKWDVSIKFSDSYTAEMDGNFYGTRDSDL